MKESDLVKTILRRLLVLAAFVCCVTTALLAAEAPRVAGVQIGPEQITWAPQVRAERWLLTVSGQGIYLREIYREGETPFVRSVAPDGAPLADGSYRWELRALAPEREAQATEREEEQAGEEEEPQRIETERGTFERRIVRKPVVASGSFEVRDGGFVVPPTEPGGEELD